MRKNIKKVVAFVALVLVVLGIIFICWKHPVVGAIFITVAVCALALLAFSWMIAPPAPEAQKSKKGQKKQQKRRKNKVEDEEEFMELEDDKSSVVIKMVTNVIRSVCKKMDPHRLLKIRMSDAYLKYFGENLEFLDEEFEDAEIEAADFGVCLFYALMNEGKAVAKNPEEDDDLAEDVNFRVALIAAITLTVNANLLDENVDPDKFKMMYPNITLPEETYEKVKNTLVEVYEKGYSQKTAAHIFNLIVETGEVIVEEIK